MYLKNHILGHIHTGCQDPVSKKTDQTPVQKGRRGFSRGAGSKRAAGRIRLRRRKPVHVVLGCNAAPFWYRKK
jgi:hypothetical protein